MAKGSLPQAVGIAPGEASLRQGKPSVDKAKQDRLAQALRKNLERRKHSVRLGGKGSEA